MELSKQVCSLDLAKRLKELGVKQESLFDWIEWGDGKHKLVYNDMEHNYNASVKMSFFSAFTVAELGEMLPEEVEREELSYWLLIQRGLRNGWRIGYRPNGGNRILWEQEANTEADARAKMLIYLLDNKLLTL